MNKEQNISVLKNMLTYARLLNLRAAATENNIFDILNSMGIDLSSPTNAENAANLEEAICCFIQYGEYSVENLLRDIQEAGR